jgi:hypothetical protein
MFIMLTKEAYLKGNIEPDPDELDLLFERTPTYAEVLEQVRIELNWMYPSDIVELECRHNAGFGMHFYWKIMHINSEQRWGAYKEVVVESLDKALELFATKKVDASLHLDLNQSASRFDARSPPPNHQEEMSDTSIEPISKEDEVLEEEEDECGDDENDIELHNHNVGDLDMYYTQENMDHDIRYSRCYASDSDDNGPDEEVDEEGFTANEAEAHEKVLGRDHWIPLFHDLSLADEATVDGSEGIVLGPMPTSYRDGNHENNGI